MASRSSRRSQGIRRRRTVGLLAVAATAVLLGAGIGCRRSSLMPRADGAAVVVAPAASTGDQDVAFVPETEPNDALSLAQKLEFGATAAVTTLGIAGQLAPPSGKSHDVDLFRLVIPAAPGTVGDAAPTAQLRRRLSVEVSPDPALTVVVEALDDEGQGLIAAAGSVPGDPEGFPNLSVTPGAYYLRVRAAATGAGAGSYRLVARLFPLETGEEQEPNGKAALASEAPASGEVIGYHGWRRDQDWYRVPLASVPEGSVLGVDLEPVPGVAASLLVYDAAERKLVESRGHSEERVAVRNVRLAPGDPHLYVVVRTDSGRNTAVRYNLRLRAELPRGGSELEPNDDAAHAQAISDGDTLGFLGRGDVDVYRYTAKAGATELDIEVTPPERVDVRLEVLRETDGFLLARADAGKRHEPERLPNLFVAGGPLLIRLSAGRGDGNSDEPYRLTVASRPPEPGAEREPNGTTATATVLPSGIAGNGLIFPRGDVDVWKAPLAGNTTGATVSVTGVAGLTLDVRVLADDEHELARFKVAGASPATTSVATGGAACCLVQVRDASAKAAVANPRDRYALTVGP
ncbi:MAG TPA: hypothetical protein VNO55_25360 [Polyangia bacterium]|nr:hypothetical protein [Polyangia bacterium]